MWAGAPRVCTTLKFNAYSDCFIVQSFSDFTQVVLKDALSYDSDNRDYGVAFDYTCKVCNAKLSGLLYTTELLESLDQWCENHAWCDTPSFVCNGTLEDRCANIQLIEKKPSQDIVVD